MLGNNLGKAPFVYVITLTWNQIEDTLACLGSLSQMTYPNYRLLLVDNGSTDGTAEAVRERFPEVDIIVNDRNLGFPGGFNVGLRRALEQGAEHVFMLNNDTFVKADILDRLMEGIRREGAGMAAPKIYFASERERIWSTGGMQSRWTLEMTDKGTGQMDRGQWDKVQPRDYLVGCALLMTRPMLEKVGLFDTGFNPIYYEDLDLCIRARKAGFQLLLIPSAQMWHKVSASMGGAESPRKRYLLARNSVRFFRKHASGAQWLFIIPYRSASALKTTILLLARGQFESISAYWRGIRHGLSVPLEVNLAPSENQDG